MAEEYAFSRMPLRLGEREYGTRGAHTTCFAYAIATWCFLTGGFVAELVGAVEGTVCLIAGPVGILLGVATVEAVGSIGELSWVSGDYSMSVFVQALAVAVGMALIGAVYPALRAVRITPVEALRYE